MLKLPNVEQINGEDKYLRNLAVIDKFKSEMDLTNIYLTSGEEFYDGLSGSALAATNCNPLFLVGGKFFITKKYLGENSIANYNVTVIGGTVAEMASIVSPNIDYEEKKISEMTDIKFDDITKIIFYDGRGGLNTPLLVEDRGKIKEFMGYLGSFVIKKSRNPELPSWWSHAAEFYINEKKVMKITFMNPMTINNKDVYDIMKADLYINQIDKFLKSIDPSHKDFN